MMALDDLLFHTARTGVIGRPSNQDGVIRDDAEILQDHPVTLTDDEVVGRSSISPGKRPHPILAEAGCYSPHQTGLSSSDAPIYVTWKRPYDPENPFDWTRAKKWRLTLAAFYFTICAATCATSYPVALPGATAALHISAEAYLTGSAIYLFTLAITPMVASPFSEVYGRYPVYLGAAIVFALAQIPLALAPNVGVLVAFRGLQGMAASVGSSMVGGSVADIFTPHERGLPMGLFSLLTFIGSTIGPMISGLIGATSLGWRWEFWWQFIFSVGNLVGVLLFLRETRGSVLLFRKAQLYTKQTGQLHRAVGDDERESLIVMARTSLTRPFVYLLTEPIVMAISLWIAFAWGCLFLLLESIPLVFAQYDFSATQQSLIFLVIGIGGLLGYLANFHQSYVFAHASRQMGENHPAPEMRLPWACAGGVLFPIGMFWYAWGGRPSVPWFIPALGLVLANAGIFPIYVAAFTYLTDVYEHYSSSALSAQSLLRNAFAGAFTLFARRMYAALGYPVASTVLASVGSMLALVPFWLFYFGRGVRACSKVAMRIEREKEEALFAHLNAQGYGPASQLADIEKNTEVLPSPKPTQ